jgi:hypothetical protein
LGEKIYSPDSVLVPEKYVVFVDLGACHVCDLIFGAVEIDKLLVP